MEKEAINKAIAALVGPEYHKPTEAEVKSGSYYQYEPDFTSDLNACHEMEATLTYTNGCSEQYGCILSQVCLQGAQLSDQLARFKILHATARQRCEAFLRTLNLWTETPERKTDK